MSLRLLLCASLLAIPTVARAQTRRRLIEDYQRERDNVLAYIDAMPDSGMTFRPTPGVRSFAGEIEHAVTTDLDVAVAVRGTAAPFAADTTAVLHQKAALRDYAARVYAYTLDAITSAGPAQLSRQISIFGQPAGAAGRLLGYAHEHSAWTLGQTIPYLRLNGVTPPAYKLPL